MESTEPSASPSSPPPPDGPPAGWCQDPSGQLRWWDGAAWGPAAPLPPGRSVEESGKALAIISWIGFFFAYGLVALVIRLVENDGNRFARWHSAEALNLQLTALVVWVAVGMPLWVATIASIDESSAAPPWPFFALFAVMAVLGLVGMAIVIVGAVRASQGRWWICPVVIPFLRVHRRERAAELAAPTA